MVAHRDADDADDGDDTTDNDKIMTNKQEHQKDENSIVTDSNLSLQAGPEKSLELVNSTARLSLDMTMTGDEKEEHMSKNDGSHEGMTECLEDGGSAESTTSLRETLGQRLLKKAGWRPDEELEFLKTSHEASYKPLHLMSEEPERPKRLGLGFDVSLLPVVPKRHVFDVDRVIPYEQQTNWLENPHQEDKFEVQFLRLERGETSHETDKNSVKLQTRMSIDEQEVQDKRKMEHGMTSQQEQKTSAFATSQKHGLRILGGMEAVNWVDFLYSLKSKFGGIDQETFLSARNRANPYELASQAIFINRAAVKLANIDKVFDICDKLKSSPSEEFIFADLCGGPGGFSEYLLWRYRTAPHLRGFIHTYVPSAPLKLNEFHELADTSKLKVCLGKDNTGDLLNRENIEHIIETINRDAGERGVNLVLADGFVGVSRDSLDSDEELNLQELKHIRLLLSQIIVAMSILAEGHGIFILKVFDLYTPMTQALLYIIYRHFEKMSIFKPFSSRPANSERYLIYRGFKWRQPAVIDHLYTLGDKLSQVKAQSSSDLLDFFEKGLYNIVDVKMVLDDFLFMDYIASHTSEYAKTQSVALKDILKYAEDPKLALFDQKAIREQCFTYWDLPLEFRKKKESDQSDDLLRGNDERKRKRHEALGDPDLEDDLHRSSLMKSAFMLASPRRDYSYLYGPYSHDPKSPYYVPINNGSTARVRAFQKKSIPNTTTESGGTVTENSSNPTPSEVVPISSQVHKFTLNALDSYDMAPRHLIRTSQGTTMYQSTFKAILPPNSDEKLRMIEEGTFESWVPFDEAEMNTLKEYLEKYEKSDSILPRGEFRTLLGHWRRRFYYFEKFDSGIRIDRIGWYEVTPESIAQHIAEKASCRTVVDAFCGLGGNTIQFARQCERVIAFDLDPARLEMARENARIYGVENRIQFILGDFMQHAPFIKADVIFLSPPWGGPTYKQYNRFLLSDLHPLDGFQIFEAAKRVSKNIIYYLPFNTDIDQLSLLANPHDCYIERNYFGKNRCIALTMYLGSLFDRRFRKDLEE